MSMDLDRASETFGEEFRGLEPGGFMRYLKYVALLAVLMLPLAYSQAQVSVGIGVGPGYGPPVCSYGYYDYYPYACAPYGYYGPDYFVDGVFVGIGPWYHWGHPSAFWNRGYASRGWYGREGWGYRGGYARGYSRRLCRKRLLGWELQPRIRQR
jgi:hypothetical protein